MGHWRRRGGGCKAGYETESGELHVPNTLKHTQEGTPEIRHVKHGVRKAVHVDDPGVEQRKGKKRVNKILLRRELHLDHQDKVDNSRDDNEVSKRKKTEGNHVATLQHPVLGQESFLQQVGWNPPAGAEWGRGRNKGCRAFKRKFLRRSPKFQEGKGKCKATAPAEVF